MNKIRNILFITLLAFASCVDPDQSVLTPTTQRVDLIIEGDITQTLFTESNGGLIDISQLNIPVVNENEYHINIDLQNNSSLCLVVYDVNLQTPIQTGVFSTSLQIHFLPTSLEWNGYGS